MNLPKAKEIIDLNINESGKKMPPDVKTALTIGSEAIYFRLQLIQEFPQLTIKPLPSETED